MKWIKASDRLPEIAGRELIVRVTGGELKDRKIICLGWFHSEWNQIDATKGKVTLFYSGYSLSKVEWLDETEEQTTSDVKQAAKEMACKFMAWYVDDPNEEVTKALMELPVDNLIEDVYDYWLIKYFNPETIVSTVPNKTNKND